MNEYFGPKRILHVCKALPHSYKSGIQTHVWKLTEWQMKMGYEISILSAGSMFKKPQVKVIEGRTVYEIPYPPTRFIPLVPLFSEEFFFNYFAARWLRKHGKGKFDLVHAQNRSGYFCTKAAHKIGIPSVTTLHGIINLEYKMTTERVTHWLDRTLHTFFTVKFQKQQMAHSDAIIAVSQGTIEQVTIAPWHGQFNDKMTVVYNGIDNIELDPTIETDPNLLVFVGRVVAIKGIYPLMEAMRKVNPDVKLVIIGDGSAVEPSREFAAKHNLGDRVHFTGPLDSSEVYRWIQKSSGLILPSFYETQGIVLMEANICNKPAIASNIQGPDEVIIEGKNGWLIPPNDVDAMANAINYWHANPEESAEMGRWGRQYVLEKFDWENIAIQTGRVYEKAAQIFGTMPITKNNSEKPQQNTLNEDFSTINL